MTFMLISCDMGDSFKGFVQDDDPKSATVVELADSYLAGNFDIAREYLLQTVNIYLITLNLM